MTMPADALGVRLALIASALAIYAGTRITAAKDRDLAVLGVLPVNGDHIVSAVVLLLVID